MTIRFLALDWKDEAPIKMEKWRRLGKKIWGFGERSDYLKSYSILIYLLDLQMISGRQLRY